MDYIELSYKDIGKRVKEERLRLGISQERLAERAGLSTTYMSHIETGSTKLSLSALHRVAWALGVQMEKLVSDSSPRAREFFEDELLQHTQDCDDAELKIIVDTIKSLKASLRKRLVQEE